MVEEKTSNVLNSLNIGSNDKKAPARTFFEHIYDIDLNTKRTFPRISTVIVSIGPASNCFETLKELIAAGMDVARINFSHGTFEEHRNTVEKIRLALDTYNEEHEVVHTLGLAMETRGPEIRTGQLDAEHKEISIKQGAKVQITNELVYARRGNSSVIYVDYPHILRDVDIGNIIIIDNGTIRLKCIGIYTNSLVCLVIKGGKLGNRKNVFLSGVILNMPTITEKDMEDIEFAIEQDFDIIFISYINNAENVRQVRDLLREKGSRMIVLAKIQTMLAVENINEIIEAADGIIISRSDLIRELPIEQICLLQKTIVARCITLSKPVIIASQLLESMIHLKSPKRSEIMDISNAVLDSVDGFLLTDETSVGENVVDTVKVLSEICMETESIVWYRKLFENITMTTKPPLSAGHAISLAAVQAAMKISASAIVLITTYGSSVRLMSAERPPCPIIAITRHEVISRQMNIYRGVLPCFYQGEEDPDWKVDINKRIMYGIQFGRRTGYIADKKPVVVLCGWKHGAEYKNTLRIIFVNDKLKAVVY